jgi:hypothetical protein
MKKNIENSVVWSQDTPVMQTWAVCLASKWAILKLNIAKTSPKFNLYSLAPDHNLYSL